MDNVCYHLGKSRVISSTWQAIMGYVPSHKFKHSLNPLFLVYSRDGRHLV